MLLKYINSNRVNVAVFVIVISFLYWLPEFFQLRQQIVEGMGVPAGNLIADFNSNYRILASIIAFLLLIANGLLLIQLNTIHIFISSRTQLPLLFYMLLILGFPQMHHLSPALISSTLVLFVFYRIFKAYKTEVISINFLDAGLLISVASMIYFPSLFFFLFLFSAMVLLRPFIWREWAFAFVGLILPYIFIVSICYVFDLSLESYFGHISVYFKPVEANLTLSQWVAWGYILFFLLISSYYIATAIDSMKIHARKFFLSFLVFFLCAILIYFAVRGSGPATVYFAAIPLSYLFTFYFVNCKRYWANDILFTIFLLLFIWQRIM